uniref:Uncharacterized protein n=1 Tax=Anguilla anguilla TaxID=7936 RepID=A0A0E9PQQ6_ANGAN
MSIVPLTRQWKFRQRKIIRSADWLISARLSQGSHRDSGGPNALCDNTSVP